MKKKKTSTTDKQTNERSIFGNCEYM